MTKIKNQPELLSWGDVDSRIPVLQIAEQTLRSLDAYGRIKTLMSLTDDRLTVGKRQWDLTKKKNIYLIGAGKAGNAMAMAVDEILGERLTKGICIVKSKEPADILRRTELIEGGHPLPNEAGRQACLQILRLIDQAGPDDLFLCLMSGGSTSLMCCPVEGVSLEDKIRTTDILLKSGADVDSINAVRRHLSRMNGGNMAKRIQARGAELIGISIYDAPGPGPTGDIGEPVEFFGTPMGPDDTTLADAWKTIRDYHLEDRLPSSVLSYLAACGPEEETPKAFPQFTYYLLNTIPDSCEAAKAHAESLGLSAHILTASIAGESKEAGTVLASLAREIQQRRRPFAPPCVLLLAGETTTRIPDDLEIKGHGGPSQELAAAFAIAAADIPGACVFSIDTEGTDGTTDAAGGLADSQTLARAESMGVDLYKALREHASYEALVSLHAAVFTGNTGTNLCDLNILYIPQLRGNPIRKGKEFQ